MEHQIARGEEFVKKAEKKLLSGWGIFGSKYYDAVDLFDKAANCFRLAKSWDRVGAVYVKLASCYNLKLDSKHEAGGAYANAAYYFMETENTRKAISCLEQAVHMFLDIGRPSVSAGYYKKIAKLYEDEERNLELAIIYYDKAADLSENLDLTASANQCKQKIAEFSAKVREKYQRSIDIFEDIARHSIRDNSLKYEVSGHLLNAGICQLCRGDVVAINDAVERYQQLDPTFSRTRECKLLVDLATAIEEEDVAKFNVVSRNMIA